MYRVYVIVNPDGRIYIGQTADLDRRLFQHNDPQDCLTLYTEKYRGPSMDILWVRVPWISLESVFNLQQRVGSGT